MRSFGDMERMCEERVFKEDMCVRNGGDKEMRNTKLEMEGLSEKDLWPGSNHAGG